MITSSCKVGKQRFLCLIFATLSQAYKHTLYEQLKAMEPKKHRPMRASSPKKRKDIKQAESVENDMKFMVPHFPSALITHLWDTQKALSGFTSIFLCTHSRKKHRSKHKCGIAVLQKGSAKTAIWTKIKVKKKKWAVFFAHSQF